MLKVRSSSLLSLSLLVLSSACSGSVDSKLELHSGDAAASDGGDSPSSDGGKPGDAQVQPSGPPPDLSAPRSSANVFFTGHSLLDNPLPEDVTAIAQGFKYAQKWNQQNVLGSPLRIRTRGDNSGSTSWDGYRKGKNREGDGMDVIVELRSPQTLGGAKYDTLVVTENHNMVDMLFWEDTVRFLRHFHDRFIAGNVQGISYLYAPWLGIRNKSEPSGWISYEKAAIPAWECVAARINRSLEAEGRSDRISTIPTSLALATLIERATTGNVAGVTGSSKQDTVSKLVSDDVHLTRMGVYYVSLVTYAAIYRRSPVGAWKPDEVDATAASSLQTIAWDVIARYYANEPKPDLSTCVNHMRDVMCSAYNTYKGENNTNSCKDRFAKQNTENPFYFSASSDRSYWFPAP